MSRTTINPLRRVALAALVLGFLGTASFSTLLAEPVASSPAEFGAFMKSELAKYEKVVKASGAKVD